MMRRPPRSPLFPSTTLFRSLEGAVSARKRVSPPALLATFPAVTGVTTIVIGEPTNTGKTSTEWVLTVLHEHFHQLEYSHPGYYAGVDSLRLSHEIGRASCRERV